MAHNESGQDCSWHVPLLADARLRLVEVQSTTLSTTSLKTWVTLSTDTFVLLFNTITASMAIASSCSLLAVSPFSWHHDDSSLSVVGGVRGSNEFVEDGD